MKYLKSILFTVLTVQRGPGVGQYHLCLGEELNCRSFIGGVNEFRKSNQKVIGEAPGNAGHDCEITHEKRLLTVIDEYRAHDLANSESLIIIQAKSKTKANTTNQQLRTMK